jgi:Asp-tRNA(Asn)/Glu-tRNA(Gln) amidotransferase B subunit
MKYAPAIGLEIHAELQTKSKVLLVGELNQRAASTTLVTKVDAICHIDGKLPPVIRLSPFTMKVSRINMVLQCAIHLA